jgi:hypothetical protein
VAAISPDGRRALLGQTDGTLLVAELDAKDADRAKADPEAFAALWNELGSDGATAYRAGCTLAGWADDAVTLIKARLEPAPVDDPALRRLIRGLNAERHVIRRACSAALAERGGEAAAALKAALKKASASVQRRQLEALLDLPGAARLPNDLRLERADWVLERIDTAAAAAARRRLARWRE